MLWVPFALKHYDSKVFVNSKITAVEKLVTEIQCSEQKLHESVEKVETQMKSFQKSIESLLNEHTTHLSKISSSVSTSSVVPESAEQIAVFLLSEQKEKEK